MLTCVTPLHGIGWGSLRMLPEDGFGSSLIVIDLSLLIFGQGHPAKDRFICEGQGPFDAVTRNVQEPDLPRHLQLEAALRGPILPLSGAHRDRLCRRPACRPE